ncbi:quinolinate synthase NadA, partial [candidate division KSB1 bacterium]|nr:quinolinate synthase NadA [candidate division KSB1 bacterium]NIV04252.1 quinolinate synthase NadA [Calditrichia bacterium]NIS23553.1 quinolinate synthase NadA [candidate division KSB1 bacterium]NIU24187.1 quinolinate synthase NadA [candidate division KSB1 bacterium]NIV96266.1 quinolinate synthase NadA [candidate division KSB1 bacterium]
MSDGISKQIKKLAKERNALILAHNYQPPEIQDIADFTGDSLELSLSAAQTDADVIVFCGVLFMAQTAAILSPDKTVLLPRMEAGCPLADMITAEDLSGKIKDLGRIPVVTYVNSPASVKAVSTICCTSANALSVVNSLDADEILMVPDRNLAQYTALRTNKTVHYWNGFCPAHESLSAEQVLSAKEAHPQAAFMAHPECRPEVLALADAVLSTSGMLKYAKDSDRKTFIVGTEEGILYPLRRQNPHKTFYSVSDSMICKDMKKIKLVDILVSLENMKLEVTVSK